MPGPPVRKIRAFARGEFALIRAVIVGDDHSVFVVHDSAARRPVVYCRAKRRQGCQCPSEFYAERRRAPGPDTTSESGCSAPGRRNRRGRRRARRSVPDKRLAAAGRYDVIRFGACRTSRLCFPASLKTWTTYLPSGEMAARVALPLEVNLRTCIDWNGGAARHLCEKL